MARPRSVGSVGSVGILLLVLVAFAALKFWPSDEARIQLRTRELAEALPRARDAAGQAALEAWLATHAAPGLVVRLPDATELVGTTEVSRAARAALEPLPSVQIALIDDAVRVEGGAASGSAVIALISQGAGELRDTRRVTTTWSKRAGQFQLDTLEIGPRRRDQPEARP